MNSTIIRARSWVSFTIYCRQDKGKRCCTECYSVPITRYWYWKSYRDCLEYHWRKWFNIVWGELYDTGVYSLIYCSMYQYYTGMVDYQNHSWTKIFNIHLFFWCQGDLRLIWCFVFVCVYAGKCSCWSNIWPCWSKCKHNIWSCDWSIT